MIVEAGGRGESPVAFATGESSLYNSTGSGIIGQPSHVHVVVQAKRLVRHSAEYSSLLSPTAAFPYPSAGTMRFYFLTAQGVLTIEQATERLRSGESPLSPLLDVGDELMSEFLQYGLTDAPVGPPKAFDVLKAFAIVGAIGGLTYAAWLIPIAPLRWPAVAIGVFFTIAA